MYPTTQFRRTELKITDMINCNAGGDSVAQWYSVHLTHG